MVRLKSNPATILDDPALRASRVITVPEARAILRCGIEKIYRLMGEGKIRSYKDGPSRRIYLYSVIEYMIECEAKGTQLAVWR
jgi:excisionase family DNA binding protein